MTQYLPTVPDDTLVAKYKFMCSIPELQSRSVNHIKIFGTPTTGDKSIDSELSKQWLTTFLSINEMVEYHKQGISIRIKNKKDVASMYDYISRYLQAWKSYLNEGLNIGGSPIDDLVAMDRFANEVYEHAKYQFTKDIADSILAKHITSTVRFNKSNFFRQNTQANNSINNSVVSTDSKESEYPARASYTDIFREKKWN